MRPATLVLASRDSAFSALVEHLLRDGDVFDLIVSTSTVELLDVARQHQPEAVLLDVDGQDIAAVKTLLSKLTLLSEARVLIASGYLSPGSPGLGGLLQTIAAVAVLKPQGSTSLSLVQADGPLFVSALRRAFDSQERGGQV